MKKSIKQYATFLLAFFCANGGSAKANRHGKLTVSDLPVFDSIMIHSAGEISVYCAPENSVSIEGPEDLMPEVVCKVTANTLHISLNELESLSCQQKVCIGMPQFKEVVLFGGGKLKVLPGFAQQESLVCKLEEGGRMDCSALEAQTAFAMVRRGGELLLSAVEFLQATIQDGGSIIYSGDPQLISHLAGAGEIKRVS